MWRGTLGAPCWAEEEVEEEVVGQTATERLAGWSSHRTVWGQQQPERDAPPPNTPS